MRERKNEQKRKDGAKYLVANERGIRHEGVLNLFNLGGHTKGIIKLELAVFFRESLVEHTVYLFVA